MLIKSTQMLLAVLDRDGHELAHKFVTNFGWFVVYKLKSC